VGRFAGRIRLAVHLLAALDEWSAAGVWDQIWRTLLSTLDQSG
jgi:hypothetical protein